MKTNLSSTFSLHLFIGLKYVCAMVIFKFTGPYGFEADMLDHELELISKSFVCQC